MSRGPAARKSGTSNPRVRRWTLGIPSSSRMPWISSASARLLRHRDLDQLAAEVLGLDLARPLVGRGDRLLLAAADVDERHLAVGAEALARAGTCGRRSGRRAARPTRCRPHSTTSSTSSIRPSSMANAAHDGLVLGQRADQPEHARPPAREVDVGLRRVGLGVGVRVEDRADLLAPGLDLVRDPDLVAGVDLKAHRAVELVRRAGSRRSGARRPRRSSRSTRSALRARVGDELVEQIRSLIRTWREASSGRVCHLTHHSRCPLTV